MKTIPFFILFFSIFVQCNSQKDETNMKYNNTFDNIEQLEGNWYHTATKINKYGIETDLIMQCEGRSFFEILKINGNYNLVKHFATVKNCEIHSNKTSRLSLKNSNLNYTECEIIRSETLENLSDRKFKITEKSFSNGEPILIEYFYTKK